MCKGMRREGQEDRAHRPRPENDFEIANQSLAKRNIGDYVEIAGQMDLQAKTVRIATLKMLRRGNASCERPKLSN
jgi:hypothetical protein